MVGWFNGILLLSAKWSRPPGGWENSLWNTIRRTIFRLSGSFFFWAMVEYHPISTRDQSRLHQFSTESFTNDISWVCIDRGENLERRHSDCGHSRIGKGGRIRNLSSKNQCRRIVYITKGRRAWSYDMEGHAQKMRWRTLWIGDQESGATAQSLKSLLGRSSIQAGRTRISWRIVRSLLTNCLEMLVLGTNWKTWHSMVSEQTCQISHQMDTSLWQTFGQINLIHSSHKWPLTSIVMLVTPLSIVEWWVYSKTQILLETLRTHNQPQEESDVFLEAEHLSPSVRCWKQTATSHSSTESEITSLDAGLRMDGLLALDFWDVVIDVLRSTHR